MDMPLARGCGLQGHLAIQSRKVPPTPDQAEIAGITVDPDAEEYQRGCKALAHLLAAPNRWQL